MVSLMVATCLATPASAVELTLWAHPDFTPSAGLPAVADAYKQAYAKFEKDNPDITLKFEVMRGGTEALQQFLTAATSNNLPDLALLDGFWIPRLVETGKLQTLDDLWSKESRGQWLPASIDAVTLNGSVYAVPFHTSWRGLFYPIDTMKKLGFDSPPQGWDDFLVYGDKAKAAGMSATMLPAAAGEVTALHMLSMFWGLGGEMVDATGKPVFFDGKNRGRSKESTRSIMNWPRKD
jgi:multiple sugar transport system substrate-binding protein